MPTPNKTPISGKTGSIKSITPIKVEMYTPLKMKKTAKLAKKSLVQAFLNKLSNQMPKSTVKYKMYDWGAEEDLAIKTLNTVILRKAHQAHQRSHKEASVHLG